MELNHDGDGDGGDDSRLIWGEGRVTPMDLSVGSSYGYGGLRSSGGRRRGGGGMGTGMGMGRARPSVITGQMRAERYRVHDNDNNNIQNVDRLCVMIVY